MPKDNSEVRRHSHLKYGTKTGISAKSKRSVKVYKIPKEKFENALKMITKENARNNCHANHLRSCVPFIHKVHERKFDLAHQQHLKHAAEARNCLIRRDWKNLAKLLTIAQPYSVNDTSTYTPIFFRYAALCLAHNPDAELMESFLQGVGGCVNDSERKELQRILCSICPPIDKD